MKRCLGAILLIVFSLATSLALAQEKPNIIEQRDNVIVIKQDFGGPMTTYMIRYMEMRAKQLSLAIDGECDSSCTLFLGYIPRQNVCVTPNAKLGFHRASRPEGTIVMMMAYPPPVVLWLLAEGITEDVKYLPAEIVNAIFAKCPEDLLKPPPPPPEGAEKVD